MLDWSLVNWLLKMFEAFNFSNVPALETFMAPLLINFNQLRMHILV